MEDGTAVVLGAREGSGNIGDAIGRELAAAGWTVYGDDCYTGDARPAGALQFGGADPREFGYTEGTWGRYEVPSAAHFERWDADALIITLGATSKLSMHEVPEYELINVLRGCLELPLLAAHRYVAADPGDGLPRHIIFVGSYGHDHPFSGGTAYCAAKAGLAMAARTLAWELTVSNYNVNIVHPYHVEGTPMWEKVQEGVMETKGWTRDQADQYARRDLLMDVPLSPAIVAQTVRLLIEEPALRWTAGQGLKLYGGTR